MKDWIPLSITAGLGVVLLVSTLWAGSTGFLPWLWVWPILFAVVGVPGYLYWRWRRRHILEVATLQGEMAWMRRLEKRARDAFQAGEKGTSAYHVMEAIQEAQANGDVLEPKQLRALETVLNEHE